MTGTQERRSRLVAHAERHQVMLFIGAIAVGGAVGIALPASVAAEGAIEPLLGALLFVTFLSVPFDRIRGSLRDGRFLATLGLLNFVVAPTVVYLLSRFVAAEPALLIGVLLVLLTPCIDYVIAFTRLAGGAGDRLLAAAPVLMIAQVALLPLYLWGFAGPDAVAVIDVGPFVRAFVLLIALPLGLAAAVQLLAPRIASVRRAEMALPDLMVPLMMATLGVVVASQIGAVGSRLGELWGLVPLYASFVVAMIALGWLVARATRMATRSARAVVFSGVTRNSLVVLPLALALPERLDLTPLVVVTQTLVELVAMVAMVHLVPRLVPDRGA